ncbi:MAG: L-aspartate oxidase [Blastocatellales bacterium]|nr:L-aspartate oxidase [Blastocatellales bacterium]
MQHSTDFIVIGSGVAGLRAAVELARHGNVVVLTKDRLDESNTEYAQGGVAVALSDDDEIGLHAEDTLNAGAGLCDEHAVRTLVEEGPRYITELIDWGAQFDREGGALAFTREAAHSRRRILHARGDSTGSEIVRALLTRARREPNITFHAHAATIGLLVEEGRCAGVEYIDPNESLMRLMRSRAVVLATGGAGQIFAQTTNPEVATGDGIAMAYAAGAEVCDLEFVQFHPTVLAAPGAPRFLLSEALRGEGGRLRNDEGELFMHRYDEREELAPRDVVSRSIVAEMTRTGRHWVYLDLTHLAATYLRERFPKIHLTCLRYGLDITMDQIPVSPAAHYLMGGVRTDTRGRTTLAGLYAAGEVTCTGVHGANRLASNSLLEGLVFGARAGADASSDAFGNTAGTNTTGEDSIELTPGDWMIDPQARYRVQDLMWRCVGLIRERKEIEGALSDLDALVDRALNRRTRNFAELARLIARAALWREESRGGHFRSDFPARDDRKWRVHSAQRREHEIRGITEISAGN